MSLFGGATYVMLVVIPIRQYNSYRMQTPDSIPALIFLFHRDSVDDLNTLSTDYNFTAGSCALGSPRFGIALASRKTIFAYVGMPPNYTNCAANIWTNTGNLLMPSSLVDSSQAGGSFCQPWAAAQAQFAGQQITDIFILSDNGPGPQSSQTVLIDNTNVNGTTYTYEPTSKEACKNSGWQNFTSAPGPFGNQGQCVSYFASGGH